MGKRLVKNVMTGFAILSALGVSAAPVLAAIPSGTVIFGDGNAYDLNYANGAANQTTIQHEVVNNGGKIYVKNFAGNLVNNTDGSAILSSVIPAVTYLDSNGKSTQYAAGDGPVVSSALSVSSVSAINSTTINVVFNQPVQVINPVGLAAALNVKDLLGAGGTFTPATAILGSDNETLVLTLSSGNAMVNAKGGYSISIPAGIAQLLSNSTVKNTATNVQFDGVATSDATAPAIGSAVYDSSNTALSLTFTKTVDLSAADFDATKLSISDGTTTVALTASDFTAAANGTSVTLNLSSATATKVAALKGSTWSLTVAANAFQDVNTTPDKSVAQTLTITQSATPVFQSATYNQANNQLQVTFTTPVVLDHSKVVNGSFTLSDSGNSVPLTNAALTTGSNNTVLTLTLAAADATTVNSWSNLSSSLQLSIAAGAVQNATGITNALTSNKAVTFTADATAPTLSSAVYNSGTNYLTLSFSKPVDLTKLKDGQVAAIAITDGTTTTPLTAATVAGNVKTAIGPASTVVIQVPGVDVNGLGVPNTGGTALDTTKPWSITFAKGTFQDLVGNQIAALTSTSGATVQFTDATAPSLVGGVTVLDNSHIQVVFSKPMDPTTSATAANYVITTTNSATPLSVTAASLGSDKETVTLTTAAQAAGQIYQVQINNVKDASGNVYQNASPLKTFTGTSTVATTSPVLSTAYYYDTNNNQKIDQGDTIVLSYNTPISVGSVVASDFVVNGAHTFGTGAIFAAGQYNNQLKITLGANPTIIIGDSIGAPNGGTADISALGGGSWNSGVTQNLSYDPAVVSKPQVVGAVITHSGNSGAIVAGDTITITMSQAVTRAGGTDATVFQYKPNAGANTAFDAGDTFTWSADKKSMTIKLDATDAGLFTTAKIAAGVTISATNDAWITNGYSQPVDNTKDSVTMQAATTTAPTLQSATVYDTNNNGVIGVGDTLQLSFSGPIVDANATLAAADLSVMHGTLTAGDTVKVDVADNTKLDITLAGVDSITNMTTVNVGSLNANITDVYGNKVQSLTNAVTASVGSTSAIPATPVVSNTGYINAAAVAGGYNVTGTAAAGSTVSVTLIDSALTKKIESAIANSSGNFTVPFTTGDLGALAAGTINVTATATNVAGNTSSIANGANLTLDKTAPATTFNASASLTNLVLNVNDTLSNADGSDLKANFSLTKSAGGATTASITSAIYNKAANTITFTIVAGDIDAGGKLNVAATLQDKAGNPIVAGTVSTTNAGNTAWQ